MLFVNELPNLYTFTFETRLSNVMLSGCRSYRFNLAAKAAKVQNWKVVIIFSECTYWLMMTGVGA